MISRGCHEDLYRGDLATPGDPAQADHSLVQNRVTHHAQAGSWQRLSLAVRGAHLAGGRYNQQYVPIQTGLRFDRQAASTTGSCVQRQIQVIIRDGGVLKQVQPDFQLFPGVAGVDRQQIPGWLTSVDRVQHAQIGVAPGGWGRLRAGGEIESRHGAQRQAQRQQHSMPPHHGRIIPYRLECPIALLAQCVVSAIHTLARVPRYMEILLLTWPDSNSVIINSNLTQNSACALGATILAFL